MVGAIAVFRWRCSDATGGERSALQRLQQGSLVSLHTFLSVGECAALEASLCVSQPVSLSAAQPADLCSQRSHTTLCPLSPLTYNHWCIQYR